MKKSLYFIYIFLLAGTVAWAGNPDRQGEAGAAQLLMNPYARSAGLHTMNTSNISGVEALQLNPAGLARINGRTQVVLGHAIYLQGTDIRFNALGLSQRVGKSGAFGFSLMSIDFGDIPVTTTFQPEGTGATFSPAFFNMGLSYSHIFENKVSVGITFRAVSESTSDINAFGFAVDGGVQYVTGEQDNFKFGISLRNVGSRMAYSGQGLATAGPAADGGAYNLTYSQRAAGFELPSVLNIGASYDFLIGGAHRLTVLGNFAANSFSRDQLGGGIEYALKERFMLRAAYKADMGVDDATQAPIYSGLSAGASLEIPTSREKKQSTFGLDYAYRATRVWKGTHNVSVRFNF